MWGNKVRPLEGKPHWFCEQVPPRGDFVITMTIPRYRHIFNPQNGTETLQCRLGRRYQYTISKHEVELARNDKDFFNHIFKAAITELKLASVGV